MAAVTEAETLGRRKKGWDANLGGANRLHREIKNLSFSRAVELTNLINRYRKLTHATVSVQETIDTVAATLNTRIRAQNIAPSQVAAEACRWFREEIGMMEKTLKSQTEKGEPDITQNVT